MAIRAFQLFSAAAVNKGDGSFVLDDTNFTHNIAPFSDDGGAMFVKESPGKPVQMRLPSLISRRGSSKRRLTSESPATVKARACDERGRLASHSTSGTNSGTGDSRVSRKLVNFRTLTWQSSQGESKEDSGPPTF